MKQDCRWRNGRLAARCDGHGGKEGCGPETPMSAGTVRRIRQEWVSEATEMHERYFLDEDSESVESKGVQHEVLSIKSVEGEGVDSKGNE